MDLRDQLHELTSRRLLAREHVEAAIFEIQRCLTESLAGQKLRLHNLHGREAPYRGVVLRGKFPDRRFDDDHPSQVVLRDDGLLVVAWLDPERGEIDDRALRLDDLDAEDLPVLVERVLYALQHHSSRVEAMTDRYAEISALACRISDALARRSA